MRKFRNLPRPKQTEINRIFPDLQEAIERHEGYTYIGITVFDHWLSRDEANQLLENVPEDEQKRRNQLLYNFSKKLLSEAEVLNFKFIGKWTKAKPLFRKFTSQEAALEYLNPAAGNNHKRFFEVVLPELKIIFMEGWDDTNIMYLKDASVKPLIQQWAKEAGVYCLDMKR
ncbi:hypothetical protein ACFOEK_14920 [Litoribrevibacter euphylliae]|uniref:Uncharacterized protein n=1 Tax=Litoribrevibacter euphylliae TaxID=1834034 RepID=A0ABV7HEL3_9GAMM